jgi:hypothetical protein
MHRDATFSYLRSHSTVKISVCYFLSVSFHHSGVLLSPLSPPPPTPHPRYQ